MANPFDSAEMAEGYAASRPPVHAHILDLVRERLEHPPPFRRALDVGCGAGISTRPLERLAGERIGIEPAVPMLRAAGRISPGARFAAAAAEALPFPDASFDLLAAAGSLNYVDLPRFFPEASRVLSPGGLLLVYDFSAGRSFPDSPGLDQWFDEFIARYPWPPGEATELNPDILARLATRFRLREHENFAIPIALSPAFYLDYMLTETNVACAVRNGMPLADVRTWCSRTLGPVFAGSARDVVFRGYFAVLAR